MKDCHSERLRRRKRGEKKKEREEKEIRTVGEEERRGTKWKYERCRRQKNGLEVD